MTTIRRLGGLLLAGALLMLAGTGVAAAHDSLISSSPEDGSTVGAGPATVTLVFSDVVQNIGPLVTVVGPDGGHYESGTVDVRDNQVSSAVNPLGPAGTYTVSYRIVSADGHPVEGTISFSLSAAGPGAPNPNTPTEDATSDSIPAWVWILAAGLVLVLVVLFGLRSTMQRSED